MARGGFFVERNHPEGNPSFILLFEPSNIATVPRTNSYVREQALFQVLLGLFSLPTTPRPSRTVNRAAPHSPPPRPHAPAAAGRHQRRRLRRHQRPHRRSLRAVLVQVHLAEGERVVSERLAALRLVAEEARAGGEPQARLGLRKVRHKLNRLRARPKNTSVPRLSTAASTSTCSKRRTRRLRRPLPPRDPQRSRHARH